MTDEARAKGLARMAEVYGWEVSDGPGDFFGYTVDHLFADIWSRPGLSDRDRRLLLIGMLVGSGQEDVLDIQLPAALGNEELTAEQLREIVIFVAHYAGWPRAARMNNQVESVIARHEKAGELMGRFDGKVSIVTGAGQGIGEGYANALAAEGASVVVADINMEKANAVAEAIVESGGAALATPVDVSSPDSCLEMAAATIDAFGRIDHLVNNAAIYHGMQIESMLRVDLDYYHRFMEVNLHGALYATRAVWKHMREVGGGAIVNQTSTAAWMAAGFYAVAKAGLNSLTINLAAELAGRNIRVNGIAPGPTDTEATHIVAGGKEHTDVLLGDVMLKRMGTPQDLANMLIFLLSDDASWITGQIFAVDGGQSKRI